MKKNESFILQILLIGVGLGLLKNGIEQWSEKKYNPQKKFNFQEFLFTGLQGGLIGGGGAAIFILLASMLDSGEIDIEDFEEVEYLQTVLASYNFDKVDNATLRKGFTIKNKIYDSFKGMLLGKPKYQGSIPQGTALSGISDLDIFVKFKKTSFSSLREMYYCTLDYFRENFRDSSLIEVRPQRRSIGLIFDILGEQVCIDVVPARRTNFKRGGNEYNLYENPSGWFSKPSRVKMNPHQQADFGSYSAAKAKVVTLLKVLKEKEEMPLKSVYIKELTKAAFNSLNGSIPKKIDKQVLLTMEYIRDNIEYKRVVSPDNSNNIISDTLTRNEKRRIVDSLVYVIHDIRENPNNFKYHFPYRENL